MIDSEQSARKWLMQSGKCDERGLARLEKLVTMLGEENALQNLVSKASLDDVWRRHIADSAQLLTHVPRGTSSWLDLGTGAGFPGLVVAALCPECAVLLVESRPRRADWLQRVCDELSLERTKVLGTRLELMDSQKVDVISARAFAPLEKLLKLAARFSTPSTTWLLPKGRSAQKELDELQGWRHMFHVEQSLTETEAGVIVGHLAGKKGKK